MSLIWAIFSTRLDKEYFKRVCKRWKTKDAQTTGEKQLT